MSAGSHVLSGIEDHWGVSQGDVPISYNQIDVFIYIFLMSL